MSKPIRECDRLFIAQVKAALWAEVRTEYSRYLAKLTRIALGLLKANPGDLRYARILRKEGDISKAPTVSSLVIWHCAWQHDAEKAVLHALDILDKEENQQD